MKNTFSIHFALNPMKCRELTLSPLLTLTSDAFHSLAGLDNGLGSVVRSIKINGKKKMALMLIVEHFWFPPLLSFFDFYLLRRRHYLRTLIVQLKWQISLHAWACWRNSSRRLRSWPSLASVTTPLTSSSWYTHMLLCAYVLFSTTISSLLVHYLTLTLGG